MYEENPNEELHQVKHFGKDQIAVKTKDGNLTLSEVDAIASTPPTPEEILSLLRASGISKQEAADLIGVTLNEMKSYCLESGGTPIPEQRYAWLLQKTENMTSRPINSDFDDLGLGGMGFKAAKPNVSINPDEELLSEHKANAPQAKFNQPTCSNATRRDPFADKDPGRGIDSNDPHDRGPSL